MFSSWTRSFQEALQNESMPNDAYYPWARKNIDNILDRGATVLVARDSESPSLLYGYIACQRLSNAFLTHWLYTKGAYRRLGIANELLAHALKELGQGAERLVYTHHTRWDDKAVALGMEHVPLERVLGKRSSEVRA